jgi:hypothetical protein
MWQQLRLFWQEFPCQQLVFPFILWISSLAMFSYNSRTLEAVFELFFSITYFYANMHNFLSDRRN